MKRNSATKGGENITSDFLSSFLLIAYGFVTWLTPNMDTFDSNGPKFLTFSILNLIVFVLLWTIVRKKIEKDFLLQFFDTKVGLSYGILIIFTLLSFTKAININESILHFSKVFTTFAGAWFVGILVSRDKKSIIPVAVALSFLLILDSFQTFNGIVKLINGEISGTISIKATYSNKNILTSAIFVKLPFALWLFFFQKNWKKYFGGFSLFLGVLATFFMSSRAFYLGVFFMSLLLVVYAFIKYKKSKERIHLRRLFTFLSLVGIAFIIFLIVQNTLYPKHTSTFTKRIESITSTENHSNKLRLTAWKQSTTQVIPKDPLLGVGVGNWKIRILEYENKYSPTYIYMYKNHNDFLEITAESGVFAGVAFIGIFGFAFWYLFVVVFRRPNEEQEKYFFLPTLGLMAYSFDAFFNFPQDRPEIQSWFALYVGISVGLSLVFWNGDSPLLKYKFKGRNILELFIVILTVFFLLASTYVLVLNKKSLVLQRDVKEELNRGELKSPSEKYLKGFPVIPDITILAEPIAVQKARFLIKEKKYKKAIEILEKDNSNPFDGRKEYFLSKAFFEKNQYDSALYYAKQAHRIKPYFYGNSALMAVIYERRGQPDKSIALWRDYVKGVKTKEQAWIIPVTLLEKLGKLEEAKSLIDSALQANPNNKNIQVIHRRITEGVDSRPFLQIYNQGLYAYKNKQYNKAVSFFSEFLGNVPKYSKAYEFRAICYYYQKKYKECIADIDKEEKLEKNLLPNIINIRGAAYLMLGNREKAKSNFLKAAQMGDKDGINNYQKHFGELPNKKNKISFTLPVKK